MNSCFFIGHREASEEIFPELAETVERHIVDYGVTEFIVGNYGGFDRMAARAVISARRCIRELPCCFCSPITRLNVQSKRHPVLTVLSTHRAWNPFRIGTLSSEQIGI